MTSSNFVVAAMVLLVPLSNALMHASQRETLRSGMVKHEHEGNAAGSIPPAQVMTGMWVGKNGDMHRTGASQSSITPRDLASGPAWRWRSPRASPMRTGLVVGTPLIDEQQNIIETTVDGEIIKFSRDGQQLWSYSAGGLLAACSVLADGKIYTILVDGTFLSLDAQTGERLWQSRLGKITGFDAPSVLVTEGLVIAAVGREPEPIQGSPTVVAASIADGHEVWRLELNDTFTYNFMASAHDGSIIFQSEFGRVYRISAIDGSVIWTQPSGGLYMTTAGVALDMDGNIYAAYNHAAGEGVVKALSFGDGHVLWERRFPLEANAAPAVGNLDGIRGGPLAVFIGLGSIPELIGQRQPEDYLTVTGKAAALNAASGETIWEWTLPEWRGPAAGEALPIHMCWPDQFSNPAVDANGTVYMGRATGRIYAMHDDNHDGQLSEESGEVSWFDAGRAFQGPPAISNGLLAAVACDGLMVFLSDSGSAHP
eukprot:CAMPEP_0178432946 /NCGR_PEP_ID=MMETSP0689_2-20121128/32652_1 /TAXON_ID=160604 /ORGANISM="Amphidinium massartii, Strain CS-259" /LENGTH=482 /DNA_ID=CAMNT_0020054959 /DNA_START=52 /DNA_END=1500 /DNA_ORIENTATION=-